MRSKRPEILEKPSNRLAGTQSPFRSHLLKSHLERSLGAFKDKDFLLGASTT